MNGLHTPVLDNVSAAGATPLPGRFFLRSALAPLYPEKCKHFSGWRWRTKSEFQQNHYL